MPFTQRAVSTASIYWHSCFCLLFSLIQASAAIDIIFDYSYDTGNYFSDDRKYIMEQVAYVFESRMGGESFAGYRPSEDLGLNSITGLGLNFTSPSSSATLQPAVGSTTSDGNVIGKANELIISWEQNQLEEVRLLLLVKLAELDIQLVQEQIYQQCRML